MLQGVEILFLTEGLSLQKALVDATRSARVTDRSSVEEPADWISTISTTASLLPQAQGQPLQRQSHQLLSRRLDLMFTTVVKLKAMLQGHLTEKEHFPRQ